MNFKAEPIQYYIDRLSSENYFSLGIYGDGEFIAATKQKVGGRNAIEETYHLELCNEVDDSLSISDENYLRGTDINLLSDTTLQDYLGDRLFYDGVVWDKDVREGNLGDFIRQLRNMRVIIVGNTHLRNLHFLLYDAFIEIPEHDCYTEIDRVERECLQYGDGVYLFSMGLSAIPLIARLHGKTKSFLMDMGSTWDIFCGIGLQRGWRGELENDPKAKHLCIASNLKDI